MISKIRHPVKTLKLEWHLFYCSLRRWWYQTRYGIRISFDGSMLPNLGKGKYVDVIRKGDYIEMHDHCNKEKPYTIRLIPYQPNHGVMVEYVDSKGRCGWRTHMDARSFLSINSTCSERESDTPGK